VTEPVFELSPSEYAQGQPYLLQFRGKGDDYCEQMEPLKEQLKEELGVDIRCFEVWYDSKNLELLQRLDKGRCGGVPFFYNKRSRRYVCGATTYDNLRKWALCEPCEPILPPPNLGENNEQPRNRVQKMIAQVKALAAEKMQERRGRGDEDDDDEED
jgi:thiol-disulfide isomerase/thioredoxin